MLMLNSLSVMNIYSKSDGWNWQSSPEPGLDEDGDARATRPPGFPAASAPSPIMPSADPAERLRGNPAGKGNEPMNGAHRRRNDLMI